MKRIINAFHNMRFRQKMILSHFSISLIPLLIFSMVLGSQLISDARKTSRSHINQMVCQMSESVDVYIRTVDKLVDHIIGIVKDQASAKEADTAFVESFLNNLMEAYPEIAGIMIAYEDDSYIGAGMSRISRNLFIEEPWFQTALAGKGELGIISSAMGRNVVTNTTYSADKIFSVVKRFVVAGPKKFNNVVVLIDIRHDIIEQLIDSISVGENSFLYVTDSANNIVYTPTNSLVYRIDDSCYQDNGDVPRIRIAGSYYWVSSYFSPYTGWRSVGVVSDQEYYQSMARIYSGLVICVIICFALVAIIAVIISDSVTRPIFALRRLMQKVEHGDFSVRFHANYSDEIGELGSSFNHMLERINTLIQQLYIEKQARLEAQLKTLHEQIKPHFLYNTLDTISWMARDHNADDVVKLVEALTNMFRIGLSRGKDFITIKEEKHHVCNYLYIQKTRYKDKLRYVIDIPDTYDSITVPKLILQPLVENAIYHGIKLKEGIGTITITGHAAETDLLISVHDDGAGVPPERLALLQEQLSHPGDVDSKIGFGLFYIAERISLCYGISDAVTIESVEGEGTTITIKIPMEKKKEERDV